MDRSSKLLWRNFVQFPAEAAFFGHPESLIALRTGIGIPVKLLTAALRIGDAQPLQKLCQPPFQPDAHPGNPPSGQDPPEQDFLAYRRLLLQDLLQLFQQLFIMLREAELLSCDLFGVQHADLVDGQLFFHDLLPLQVVAVKMKPFPFGGRGLDGNHPFLCRRFFYRLPDLQELAGLVLPPFHRPEVIKPPTQQAQDAFLVHVPVPGGFRVPVVQAVAEDPQQISVGLIRVHHCQINFELGAADISLHPISHSADSLCHQLRKSLFSGSQAMHRHRQSIFAPLGELQKCPQPRNPLGTGPGQVDLFRA